MRQTSSGSSSMSNDIGLLAGILLNVLWGFGGGMSTVQQYREYAEGCRALAEKLTDPNDKRAVLMMAEAWDRIANEGEAQLKEQN